MNVSERIGATEINVADLALIGEAVLNLAAAATLLRHATPVGATEYAEPSTVPQRIACDFAAWCGGKEEQGETLTAFLRKSGWLDHMTAPESAAS